MFTISKLDELIDKLTISRDKGEAINIDDLIQELYDIRSCAFEEHMGEDI